MMCRRKDLYLEAVTIKNKSSEFTNGIICRVCYDNSQVVKIE